MAHGGARTGAGRKKGVSERPQIRDFFNEDEIKEVIAHLKVRYKENDKVLVHLIEQIMGKPQQFVDVTSDGERLFENEHEEKAKKAVREFVGRNSSEG